MLTALAVVPLFSLRAPAQEENEGPRILESTSDVRLARQKAEPPLLSVWPRRMRAQADEGDSATQRIELSNTGGGEFVWRVVSAPRWVRVMPANGILRFRGRERASVHFSSEGLRPGAESGRIIIEAEGVKGSPFSVPVTFTIDRTRATPSKPNPPTRVELPPPPPTWRERRSKTPSNDSSSKPGRFGVRMAGGFRSNGDQADSDGNLVLGGYFSRPFSKGRGLSYEIAADIGTAATVGAYTTVPVSGCANVIYAPTDADAPARPYAAAGGGLLVEAVTEDASGDRYTNFAGLLNLGGGVLLGEGRLDVRLTYGFLLGSENVVARGQLAVGYAF